MFHKTQRMLKKKEAKPSLFFSLYFEGFFFFVFNILKIFNLVLNFFKNFHFDPCYHLSDPKKKKEKMPTWLTKYFINKHVMTKLRRQQRLKGKVIEKINDQIKTFQNVRIKMKMFPKYRDQKRCICKKKNDVIQNWKVWIMRMRGSMG